MFGSKAFFTALVLLHVVQFSDGKTWWKRHDGFCNRKSSNCGAECNVNSDCQDGECWKDKDDCVAKGHCNAKSNNCGDECSLKMDCPGGDCWADQDDCGTSSGYCNAASMNCGAWCNSVNAFCPGGECWKEREDCGGTPTGDHIVGTYIGALPGGTYAPSLSSVPSEVNYMLLGFAKDPSYTGKFVAFSEWGRLGITYNSITSDKAANPGRKYMISIGGSANFGGTFGISGGMSFSQWVDNADNSISGIVNSYNADGVDIQFEGGTSDPDFSTAITQLAQRFKARGFLVSVGPFRGYDGTWNDYISLPLNDVDYVFCQFYANDLQSVDSVVRDITSAAMELGSWEKLIVGFNSNNRIPSPSTALQAVYQLKSSLKGTFTWSAEDSQSNSPPYCIEKNSANILNNNQQPGSCNW